MPYRYLPERFFKKKKIKNIGEIFSDINLYKNKKKKKLIDDEILSIWENHMDSTIKEHSNVLSVKSGTVYIEVDSNPWLHHFTNFCKHDILDTFQREANKTFVSDIKFKLTSGS